MATLLKFSTRLLVSSVKSTCKARCLTPIINRSFSILPSLLSGVLKHPSLAELLIVNVELLTDHILLLH